MVGKTISKNSELVKYGEYSIGWWKNVNISHSFILLVDGLKLHGDSDQSQAGSPLASCSCDMCGEWTTWFGDPVIFKAAWEKPGEDRWRWIGQPTIAYLLHDCSIESIPYPQMANRDMENQLFIQNWHTPNVWWLNPAKSLFSPTISHVRISI